jgi:hypothetical protein
MMKNILIFGSCVTRDIFRLYPDDFQVIDYFARSSIVSLNSRPLNDFSLEDIKLSSDFQKRMVIRDFLKEFFPALKKIKFDYLLIDFADERFNVLTSGESIITKSNELINSGFLENKQDTFQEISRLSLNQVLWQDACNYFIKRIIDVVNPNRIVLVKVKLAETYRNKDGQVQSFDREKDQIKSYNALLESYYSYFESQCTGCNIVEEEVLADEMHKWGLSPYHYTGDWYRKICGKLELIMKEMGTE